MTMFENCFSYGNCACDTFEILSEVFFNSATSLLGIAGNIVNILVFYRQGIMSHSSTVGLAAISLSDLIYSVSSLLRIIFYSHYNALTAQGMTHMERDHFHVHSTKALDAGRMAMTNTGFLTSIVAMERMVSVLLPFHVKFIFRPKGSLVVVFCMALFTIALHYKEIDPYILSYHAVYHARYAAPLREFSTKYRGGFRIASWALLATSNAVIAIKVLSSKKFRKSVAPSSREMTPSSGQDHACNIQNRNKGTKTDGVDKKVNATSRKEMKLVGMIVLMSVMYIVCFTCDLTLEIVVLLEALQIGPNMDFFNRKEYLSWQNRDFIVVGSLITRGINASGNIFIYYTMSAAYKQHFNVIFRRGKQ